MESQTGMECWRVRVKENGRVSDRQTEGTDRFWI